MNAYKDQNTNMWLVEAFDNQGLQIQALNQSLTKAVLIIIKMRAEHDKLNQAK